MLDVILWGALLWILMSAYRYLLKVLIFIERVRCDWLLLGWGISVCGDSGVYQCFNWSEKWRLLSMEY